MSSGDSVSRQIVQKEHAVRKLEMHVADVLGVSFDRQFVTNLREELRFPEWSNSHDSWTYFICREVRDSWNHLDPMGRICVHLLALHARTEIRKEVEDEKK